MSYIQDIMNHTGDLTETGQLSNPLGFPLGAGIRKARSGGFFLVGRFRRRACHPP